MRGVPSIGPGSSRRLGVGVQAGQFGGVAVVAGDARSGVLGVEDRVDDQLPRCGRCPGCRRSWCPPGGSGPAGPSAASPDAATPTARVCRRASASSLTDISRLDQRPQHLDPGGIGEHPEHLDHQTHLIPAKRCRDDYLHSYVDSRPVLGLLVASPVSGSAPADRRAVRPSPSASPATAPTAIHPRKNPLL